MLKIKLPIPPYNEEVVKRFCNDIVEVKFDTLPDPISCIATVNHGADIENIANIIRNKNIFGKNIEVEVINDDESLYQEHIETDEDDDCLEFFNDFEKNITEPIQEGIDDETFVKLLQMRLHGPQPIVSEDDIIEILSETTEEDLDNEEVLSKIDDEANTFIHGLLEIQNLYTTKSGEEKTLNSSTVLINESTADKSLTDTETDFDKFVSGTNQNNDKLEKNLKRPSEFGGISVQSLLDTIYDPLTDCSKKVKRDRLDRLSTTENVINEGDDSVGTLNQSVIKQNRYASDLNCNSTNASNQLSSSEYNGTSEDATTC